MLSLNLLSPQKKNEVQKEMLFFSLQYIISITLIGVAIIGIILLIAKIVMQNSFNQAVNQSLLVTKEYGQLNQQVRITNEKIILFDKIQKEFISWSPKLTALTELTPKNIEIISININNATQMVKINGFAKNRDALLIYKQRLESSGFLEEINLPIESLLKAEDLDFILEAKLLK